MPSAPAYHWVFHQASDHTNDQLQKAKKIKSNIIKTKVN